MAGIGEASSILALTIFAFQSSKSLYDAVSSFKSQRKAIKDVQTDLGSLVTVLDLIRQQAQGSQDGDKFEPLRDPLQCCQAICQEMQEMLDVCTSHAKDGRDSVRDWLNMQYRAKSFTDMKQRLASYKSTLSIAFALINMYSAIPLYSRIKAYSASDDYSTTKDSLKQLKDVIEGTKEDLEDQLDQVRQAITTAAVSLRDTLEADQARLQRSLDGLAQAQRIADNSQSQVVIERNRAGQGSRTLFGTDTSQPRFNLTVSDNEAQTGAVIAAGVHSPQTLQALLGESRTADLALVLQALQTQLPSTISTTLQSHLNNISATDRHGLTDRPSATNVSPSLRISEQEDTPDVVEMPAQSTGAVHKDDGEYDEASGCKGR
jgi:hypothetical protein